MYRRLNLQKDPARVTTARKAARDGALQSPQVVTRTNQATPVGGASRPYDNQGNNRITNPAGIRRKVDPLPPKPSASRRPLLPAADRVAPRPALTSGAPRQRVQLAQQNDRAARLDKAKSTPSLVKVERNERVTSREAAKPRRPNTIDFFNGRQKEHGGGGGGAGAQGGGDDLSRASSISNLNAEGKGSRGALAKVRKSISKDRLDNVQPEKKVDGKKGKNNNQETPTDPDDLTHLQQQLEAMSSEKSNLMLQLGDQRGQLSTLQKEVARLMMYQEQSAMQLEQLNDENAALRNKLRDVVHSPLSDNEKQMLLLDSQRHHNSAPASIAANLLSDGGGDNTACSTPDWDKQSSSNVSEVSVACLQDKINQMQETHYSTNEELQATLQELTDLQRQLTELQQDNEHLLEEKNLMFDSLCRQTERLNDARSEIESLKQLLYRDKDDGQYESVVEREQKLVDLLKGAQEERELLLVKQEQFTNEIQDVRSAIAQRENDNLQLTERVRTLESTLDAKHAEHRQLDQDLARAKDKCSSRQIEIDRLTDLLENARTKITELEQERALIDKSELDEMLDNARKEKDALESEVAHLKEQVARARNEGEKLREQVSILQEECKVLRNNAKCTQSELEYKVEKLTAEKSGLLEQLQRIEEAANELQVQTQCQLEDKRQLSSVLSETQRNMSEVERRNNDLEVEVKELKKLRNEENEEWEKFQNDLLTSVRVANDFKTEAQQELQKLIMENKAHREKIRQLESQIEKIKDTLESTKTDVLLLSSRQKEEVKMLNEAKIHTQFGRQQKEEIKLLEELKQAQAAQLLSSTQQIEEIKLLEELKQAEASTQQKEELKLLEELKQAQAAQLLTGTQHKEEMKLLEELKQAQASTQQKEELKLLEELKQAQASTQQKEELKLLEELKQAQAAQLQSSTQQKEEAQAAQIEEDEEMDVKKREQHYLKVINNEYAKIDPSIALENLQPDQQFIVKIKRSYDRHFAMKRARPLATKKGDVAISKPTLTSVYDNPDLKRIADSEDYLEIEDHHAARVKSKSMSDLTYEDKSLRQTALRKKFPNRSSEMSEYQDSILMEIGSDLEEEEEEEEREIFSQSEPDLVQIGRATTISLEELYSKIDLNLPEDALDKEERFVKKLKQSLDVMGRKSTLRKKKVKNKNISAPSLESVMSNQRLLEIIENPAISPARRTARASWREKLKTKRRLTRYEDAALVLNQTPIDTSSWDEKVYKYNLDSASVKIEERREQPTFSSFGKGSPIEANEAVLNEICFSFGKLEEIEDTASLTEVRTRYLQYPEEDREKIAEEIEKCYDQYYENPENEKMKIVRASFQYLDGEESTVMKEESCRELKEHERFNAIAEEIEVKLIQTADSIKDIQAKLAEEDLNNARISSQIEESKINYAQLQFPHAIEEVPKLANEEIEESCNYTQDIANPILNEERRRNYEATRRSYEETKRNLNATLNSPPKVQRNLKPKFTIEERALSPLPFEETSSNEENSRCKERNALSPLPLEETSFNEENGRFKDRNAFIIEERALSPMPRQFFEESSNSKRSNEETALKATKEERYHEETSFNEENSTFKVRNAFLIEERALSPMPRQFFEESSNSKRSNEETALKATKEERYHEETSFNEENSTFKSRNAFIIEERALSSMPRQFIEESSNSKRSNQETALKATKEERQHQPATKEFEERQHQRAAEEEIEETNRIEETISPRFAIEERAFSRQISGEASGPKFSASLLEESANEEVEGNLFFDRNHKANTTFYYNFLEETKNPQVKKSEESVSSQTRIRSTKFSEETKKPPVKKSEESMSSQTRVRSTKFSEEEKKEERSSNTVYYNFLGEARSPNREEGAPNSARSSQGIEEGSTRLQSSPNFLEETNRNLPKFKERPNQLQSSFMNVIFFEESEEPAKFSQPKFDEIEERPNQLQSSFTNVIFSEESEEPAKFSQPKFEEVKETNRKFEERSLPPKPRPRSLNFLQESSLRLKIDRFEENQKSTPNLNEESKRAFKSTRNLNEESELAPKLRSKSLIFLGETKKVATLANEETRRNFQPKVPPRNANFKYIDETAIEEIEERYISGLKPPKVLPRKASLNYIKEAGRTSTIEESKQAPKFAKEEIEETSKIKEERLLNKKESSLKKEERSLNKEERHPTKEDRPLNNEERHPIEEERSLNIKESPSTKEERPRNIKGISKTKDEWLLNKEESLLNKEEGSVDKEERRQTKEERPSTEEGGSLIKEERLLIKEERPLTKEERSPTKEEEFSNEERPRNMEEISKIKGEWPLNKEESLLNKEESLLNKEERSVSKEERRPTKEERPPTKETPSTKEGGPLIKEERLIIKKERPLTKEERSPTKEEEFSNEEGEFLTEEELALVRSIRESTSSPLSDIGNEDKEMIEYARLKSLSESDSSPTALKSFMFGYKEVLKSLKEKFGEVSDEESEEEGREIAGTKEESRRNKEENGEDKEESRRNKEENEEDKEESRRNKEENEEDKEESRRNKEENEEDKEESELKGNTNEREAQLKPNEEGNAKDKSDKQNKVTEAVIPKQSKSKQQIKLDEEIFGEDFFKQLSHGDYSLKRATTTQEINAKQSGAQHFEDKAQKIEDTEANEPTNEEILELLRKKDSNSKNCCGIKKKPIALKTIEETSFVDHHIFNSSPTEFYTKIRNDFANKEETDEEFYSKREEKSKSYDRPEIFFNGEFNIKRRNDSFNENDFEERPDCFEERPGNNFKECTGNRFEESYKFEDCVKDGFEERDFEEKTGRDFKEKTGRDFKEYGRKANEERHNFKDGFEEKNIETHFEESKDEDEDFNEAERNFVFNRLPRQFSQFEEEEEEEDWDCQQVSDLGDWFSDVQQTADILKILSENLILAEKIDHEFPGIVYEFIKIEERPNNLIVEDGPTLEERSYDHLINDSLDDPNSLTIEEMPETKEERDKMKEESSEIKEETHAIKETTHETKEKRHEIKEERHKMKEKRPKMKEESYKIKEEMPKIKEESSEIEETHKMKEERHKMKEERPKMKEECYEIKAERLKIKEESSEIEETRGIKAGRRKIKEESSDIKENMPKIKEESNEIKEERPVIKEILTSATIREKRPEIKEERHKIHEERLKIKEESSKIKETHEIKENRPKIKEEINEIKEERPVIKERLTIREKRPEIKEERHKINEERFKIKEESSNIKETLEIKENRPKIKEERNEINEKRPVIKERLTIGEKRPEIKEEKHKIKEDTPKKKEETDGIKEERHKIKEERPKIKEEMHTIKEENSEVKETHGIKESRSKIKEETHEIKEKRAVIKKERPEIKEKPRIQEKRPNIKEERPKIKEETHEIKEKRSIIKEEMPEIKEKPRIQEKRPEIKEERPKVKEESSEIKEERSETKEKRLETKGKSPEIKEKPKIKEKGFEIKEESHNIKEEGLTVKEESHKIKEEGSTVKEESDKIKEEGSTVKEESDKIKEEGPTVKEEIHGLEDGDRKDSEESQYFNKLKKQGNIAILKEDQSASENEESRHLIKTKKEENAKSSLKNESFNFDEILSSFASKPTPNRRKRFQPKSKYPQERHESSFDSKNEESDEPINRTSFKHELKKLSSIEEPPRVLEKCAELINGTSFKHELKKLSSIEEPPRVFETCEDFSTQKDSPANKELSSKTAGNFEESSLKKGCQRESSKSPASTKRDSSFKRESSNDLEPSAIVPSFEDSLAKRDEGTSFKRNSYNNLAREDSLEEPSAKKNKDSSFKRESSNNPGPLAEETLIVRSFEDSLAKRDEDSSFKREYSNNLARGDSLEEPSAKRDKDSSFKPESSNNLEPLAEETLIVRSSEDSLVKRDEDSSFKRESFNNLAREEAGSLGASSEEAQSFDDSSLSNFKGEEFPIEEIAGKFVEVEDSLGKASRAFLGRKSIEDLLESKLKPTSDNLTVVKVTNVTRKLHSDSSGELDVASKLLVPACKMQEGPEELKAQIEDDTSYEEGVQLNAEQLKEKLRLLVPRPRSLTRNSEVEPSPSALTDDMENVEQKAAASGAIPKIPKDESKEVLSSLDPSMENLYESASPSEETIDDASYLDFFKKPEDKVFESLSPVKEKRDFFTFTLKSEAKPEAQRASGSSEKVSALKKRFEVQIKSEPQSVKPTKEEAALDCGPTFHDIKKSNVKPTNQKVEGVSYSEIKLEDQLLDIDSGDSSKTSIKPKKSNFEIGNSRESFEMAKKIFEKNGK